MSSGLTGDFDAVLEVSGGTFNRLLASMHQNGYSDPAKPSFPHVTHFRLGEGRYEDEPRGSVSAQIGVPRLVLINGASDRFRVEVGFRARYRADPESTPLADVIHGTVRADYRFREVDDDCWGWHGIADEYLWMRVIESSVSFEGTVYNESIDLAVGSTMDDGIVKELVTKQLAKLLAAQFAPTPQPIGKRFRHGIRFLAFGSGPDQSAVAIPVALSGEAPVGNPASLNELFLGSRDFGLAVSGAHITAGVQSELDSMVGLQRDLHVRGDAGPGGGLEIDYHVRLDSVAAEWLGPLSTPVSQPGQGVIRARFSGSGWATRLYTSGIFDIGSVSLNDLRLAFTVDQLLTLSFNPNGERVVVSAFGPPSVSVSYGGPFGGEVTVRAQNEISAHVQANIGAALGRAQQRLNALTGPAQKSPLVDQLGRIDAVASARFDEAVFRPDGMVVRGAIGLARRHVPRVTFAKTPAGDGFDAIESWIPGGRIDSLEWSWRWYTNPIQDPPGPPGSSVTKHDFLLRRPYGGKTKFGMVQYLNKPLPGLDGSGKVCLTIKGVRVDSNTGALVPIESVTECEQFGYEFHMPIEVAPWVPICDPLLGPKGGLAPEIGVVQVGASIVTQAAFNNLVLFLGGAWNEELVTMLTAGLGACRREGAGLLVSLLFDEGFLRAADLEIREKLKTLAAELEAPMLVSENVREGWSTALGLPEGSGPAWRLIRPDGLLSWAKDGSPEGEELSWVLDKRLVVSSPPGLASMRPGMVVGDHLPIDLMVPPCPPVPLSRTGLGGSKLVFVQAELSSSLALLEQLARARREEDRAPDDMFVAAVVVGADVAKVERLHAELKLDFPVFPDPSGALTRQAGVRFWPTTLTLDDVGRLTGFAMGLDLEEGDPCRS